MQTAQSDAVPDATANHIVHDGYSIRATGLFNAAASREAPGDRIRRRMNSRRRAGGPHLGRHRWLGRSTFAWQHLDDIRVDQNIIAAREDRLPNRWPISHLNQATPHRDMTRVVDLYGAARP